MQCINNSYPPARRNTRNCLCILKVWVHASFSIKEKNFNKLCSFGDIAFITCKLVSRSKCSYAIAQGLKRKTVLSKILWVGFAILLDVGKPVGLFRVGPPVIAIGVKIIDTPLAEFCRESCYRYRFKFHSESSSFHDSLAINARNIDF